MRLLDRYIGRAVIAGFVLVALVLLTLIGFVELEKEVEEVGRGSYGLQEAFLYVGLVLPRFAFEIFPIAALLGSLFGLGALASNSELVAMRAAGVSMGRIAASVIKAGLLLTVAAALVGEVLAPYAEQEAQRMRAEAISGQVALKTKHGFWTRDGDSFINIRQVLPGGRLADLYIYELDADQALRLATHAKLAWHQGDGWLLQGIAQSELTEDEVRSRTLDQAFWSSLLDPALVRMLMVDPAVLPAWGLYHYISFLHENDQDAREYEVAFWSKVVTPLVVLVMLYLSLPFVFGSLRTVGVGQRIFGGAVVGMVFLLMNKAFAHMAVVYKLDPLFAAVFPGVACLGLALWMVRRV